jgi:hypothetical protein
MSSTICSGYCAIVRPSGTVKAIDSGGNGWPSSTSSASHAAEFSWKT